MLGIIKASFIRGTFPLGTGELKFKGAVSSKVAVSEYKRKKIENFDVTKITSGHTSYRKHLGAILRRINFG